MNKRKILMVTAVVLCLAAWIYYFNFVFKPDFTEVKRGDMMEKLNVMGKVITSDSVDVEFQENGRVDKINIALGDSVKRGDILASLDSKELDAELKKAQAQIYVAKAQLSQLLAGTRSEELSLFETQVESARVDLENAQKNFENVKIKADNDIDNSYQTARNVSDQVLLSTEKAMQLLNSIYQPSNQFQTFFFIPDFSKKSDAEWQIIFTKDAFKKIKADYESLKDDPSNKNTDTVLSDFKVNLELIRVALNKTSEALESASAVSGDATIEEFKNSIINTREDINSIQTEILNKERSIKEQEVVNQTSITAADSLVSSKRAALAEKEEQLALKKAKPRDVEVAVYDAQIKDAEALKYLVEEKLKNTKVFAPISGVVKNINTKQGQLVESGSPVMSISGSSDFQIETEVLKSDSDKLRVGDEVDIDVNLSDATIKEIKGSIISIDTSKEISKNDDVYYKVFIVSSENDVNLKPDMRVELVVNAVIKRNVLIVPENAITEKNGVFSVILLEDDSNRSVDIEVGLRSNGMVEVLAGLYEGDRVIVR